MKRTYWVSPLVKSVDEDTITASGVDIVEKFGPTGSVTDVLTEKSKFGDNVILMTFTDQLTEDMMEQSGIQKVGTRANQILDLKLKIVKQSFPEIKEA